MKSLAKLVVTIDGPAGVGKSTAAGKLARSLGLIHLNSGALFRAVGLAAHRDGIPLEDDEQVSERAKRIDFEFVVNKEGKTELFVDKKNQDKELRSPLASELASKVAVLPKLRMFLLEVQREIGRKQPLVVEGRDAGTIVFVDAPMKFYLDASVEVRAGRRSKETGEAPEEVLRQAVERDQRDSTRTVAPMMASEDAVVIDTSDLSEDEVVQQMLNELRRRKLIASTPI